MRSRCQFTAARPVAIGRWPGMKTRKQANWSRDNLQRSPSAGTISSPIQGEKICLQLSSILRPVNIVVSPQVRDFLEHPARHTEEPVTMHPNVLSKCVLIAQ